MWKFIRLTTLVRKFHVPRVSDLHVGPCRSTLRVSCAFHVVGSASTNRASRGTGESVGQTGILIIALFLFLEIR
jgi:hypothetical protein